MKDPIVQEFNGKLWISAEHHVHAVEYAMEIVAAAEREACAKLVSKLGDDEDDGALFRILKDAAIAIRARGQE